MATVLSNIVKIFSCDLESSSIDTLCSSVSVLRSKRRCVLEKKQPYSGDEWCSGPDTEEDDDKPRAAMHREWDCFYVTMPVVVILTLRVIKACSDIHTLHLVLL